MRQLGVGVPAVPIVEFEFALESIESRFRRPTIQTAQEMASANGTQKLVELLPSMCHIESFVRSIVPWQLLLVVESL